MSKPILQALRGEILAHVPFWFMRQAGRYLPEYRELRAQKGGFLAMAFDPKAACEVTLQPIRRFGMDAAIIFSDILTIPLALGQHLEFVKGEGPKLGPLDIDALNYQPGTLQPVYDALGETAAQLSREGFDQTTLIGFAGAPWTVATYMIEGGSSRDFLKVKRFSYEQPESFQTLIDILVETTADYLIRQVEAGAEALQIFDSWSGVLDFDSFERYSLTPAKEIIRRVKDKHPDIPVIGFPKGAGSGIVKYMRETDINGLGLDNQISPEWAKDNLQDTITLQGNLDPISLLAGGEAMEKQARHILETLGGKPFIFNLGHGIHKDTPIAHVEKLVEIIREY